MTTARTSTRSPASAIRGRRGRPSTSTRSAPRCPTTSTGRWRRRRKTPKSSAQREEERARWNVEYGKVLSNTATDEEIDAYYARPAAAARGLPRVHRLLARPTTATRSRARRRAAEARRARCSTSASRRSRVRSPRRTAPRRARGGASGVARRAESLRRRRARSALTPSRRVASRLMRSARHPDVRQHGTSTRAFGYIPSRFSLIAHRARDTPPANHNAGGAHALPLPSERRLRRMTGRNAFRRWSTGLLALVLAGASQPRTARAIGIEDIVDGGNTYNWVARRDSREPCAATARSIASGITTRRPPTTW